MIINQKSSKLVRQFTLITITTVSLFTSTTYGAFVAESHACKSSAPTGSGSGVGNFYAPSTRNAVTHQVNETFSQTLTLQANLTAYADSGGPPVYQNYNITTSAPGVANNNVSTQYTNQNDAPGHLVSYAVAWHPTMMRFGGTYISQYDSFDSNDCRTKIVSF